MYLIAISVLKMAEWFHMISSQEWRVFSMILQEEGLLLVLFRPYHQSLQLCTEIQGMFSIIEEMIQTIVLSWKPGLTIIQSNGYPSFEKTEILRFSI